MDGMFNGSKIEYYIHKTTDHMIKHLTPIDNRKDLEQMELIKMIIAYCYFHYNHLYYRIDNTTF